MAHDYGARFRIVYLDPGRESGETLKLCVGRNQKRSRQVPRDVIFGLLSRMTPPTLAECHELILT
jgi:predicted kinase